MRLTREFGPARWLRGTSITASFAFHGLLYVLLSRGELVQQVPRPRQKVEVRVQPPKPAIPPLAPAPEIPPPPPPRPREAPRAQPRPPPLAAVAVPEPATPAPLDLTGVTLTGNGGSFLAHPGNGAPRSGPLRMPHAAPKIPEPVPVRPDAPAAEPLRSLRDLSEVPVPPDLNPVLEQHYPVEARRQGRSGQAVVMVRLDPDGRVQSVRLISESEVGFGAACRATLLGSEWQAGKDKSGRSVAVEVRYTCRFEVLA